MYIIDKKLKQREKEGNPIRVGVIGAGEMSKGLTNQICNYTPGMSVAAIYNRSTENAKLVLENAKIDSYKVSNNYQEFQNALDNEIPVITNEIDFLLESNSIDVLVEMTGHIKFGVQTILRAFEKGKHVVSFNAELEATLGPLLRDRAAKAGVKYTLGDGDQPGVTLNLFRHVESMGFTPLVCGNIKGLQDHYRNPTTQKGFAAQWGMTPEMVTSFADGTKISFEQACIANATNMCIAQRGMIGLNSKEHVDDLTGEFDVEKLKELGGIVDYVVGAKPGPGVFVYATTEDPLSVKYLKYGKLGDGPLYSFYIPYHLLFFELAFSIARLIDFNDVTIDAEYGQKVEVVAVAKEDLKANSQIDGLGGYNTYGVCENFEPTQQEELLPMGLAEGITLKTDIKKDQLITLNDIDYSADSYLFDLYNDQLNLN